MTEDVARSIAPGIRRAASKKSTGTIFDIPRPANPKPTIDRTGVLANAATKSPLAPIRAPAVTVHSLPIHSTTLSPTNLPPAMQIEKALNPSPDNAYGVPKSSRRCTPAQSATEPSDNIATKQSKAKITISRLGKAKTGPCSDAVRRRLGASGTIHQR